MVCNCRQNVFRAVSTNWTCADGRARWMPINLICPDRSVESTRTTGEYWLQYTVYCNRTIFMDSTSVCVVFTLNRPFYPASSVRPVCVLIPYPRVIIIMWLQTVGQRKTENKNNREFTSQASKRSAYRIRDNTNTIKTRKYELKYNETKINYGMKQNTNDARRSKRLLDGKLTYSGRTDSCCTDEATRRRGGCRHKDSGEGRGIKGRDNAKSKKEERRGKKENIVLQAVIQCCFVYFRF